MTTAVPTPEDHLAAIAAIFAASVRRDPRRGAIDSTLTMLDSLAARFEVIPLHPEIAATSAMLKRCSRVLRGDMQ